MMTTLPDTTPGPMPIHTVAPEPELAVDPSLEANARVAKRPRLDEHLDHSPQPSLDEDALLHTLAAHNQAEAEAQYEPE